MPFLAQDDCKLSMSNCISAMYSQYAMCYNKSIDPNKQQRTEANNMVGIKDQKFGVEIEMTAIDRESAAELIASLFSERFGRTTTAIYEGTGYMIWSVLDNEGRKWKFMYDSSIRAEAPGRVRFNRYDKEDDYKCEMVTPPLNYGDLDLLQTVVRALKDAGAVVNEKCGMHVHVDAANHDGKSLRNLLILQATKQDMLYRAVAVIGDRLSYADKIEDFVFEAFKEAKSPTLDNLEKLWYGLLGCGSGRSTHYNQSRYHGLNLHNVWFRGTVEWRLFNATVEADEVLAAVQLCLAMSAKAIAATNGFFFDKADAYSAGADKRMYTWLTGMGLKGEEFKTARAVLSKNLKDAA